MLKIRSTCNKNYVEKFGVERPADWDYKYINYPCSDEELAEQCKDADVIHCGPVDFFRKEVIDKLENVKLIQSLGVGFDKIDLEAAKAKASTYVTTAALTLAPSLNWPSATCSPAFAECPKQT